MLHPRIGFADESVREPSHYFYRPVAWSASVRVNSSPTSQRSPVGMTVPPNRISEVKPLMWVGLGLGAIFQRVPSQCNTRVNCWLEPSAAKNEPNAQMSFA